MKGGASWITRCVGVVFGVLARTTGTGFLFALAGR